MKNRTLNIAFWVAVISLFLFSCEEENPNFKDYSNYYPVATASRLSPATGFPGQNITITGTNLDTLTGAVKVWFGDIMASDIVSSNGTQIVVQVPDDAVSGPIDLQVWTTKIDSIGTFTVFPKPEISSVVSRGIAGNIAEAGDTVIITGQNFLTDIENVSIDFNGTPAAKIVSLAGTLIKVIAPSGYTTGNVSATFNGDYTVVGTALAPGISPGDVSVLFLKNYMQPFTANNMTEEQGFNGTNWATPDFWTVNSAAQNQINSGASERCGGAHYGKPNMANVGELALQAGWSDAIGNEFTNGKMYQTTLLPAGSYRVDIEIMESGFNDYQNSSAIYLVVANGDVLPDLISPDIAPAPALATELVQNGIGYGGKVNQSLTFTLLQQKEVSIGFVGTMRANSYVRFNYVKLTLLE